MHKIKEIIIWFLSKIFKLAKQAYQLNIYNEYRKKYNIHKSFIFNGNCILMYGNGIINIGENTYIGRNSILQVSSPCELKIGKNCKIGPSFSLWTHSSKVDFDYNYDEKIEPKIGNIIIGDAVWIGANVVISPGITIGNNSIIGANSVVCKDVPENAIVGGVPARIIRFKKFNN